MAILNNQRVSSTDIVFIWTAVWPIAQNRFLQELGIFRVKLMFPWALRLENTSELGMGHNPRDPKQAGWWLSHLPLWKMMDWKSLGIMTFPIYGKS